MSCSCFLLTEGQRFGNELLKTCKKDDGQKAISLVEKGGPEVRDMKRKGKRETSKTRKCEDPVQTEGVDENIFQCNVRIAL